MTERKNFAGAAIIGAREHQEDAWAVLPQPPGDPAVRLMAIVADGLGGHAAGEHASQAAVAGFLKGFRETGGTPRERLAEALEEGNREVCRSLEEDPARSGMGTTVVAAAFGEGRCAWISVGDSLLFRCRAGKPERLNPLHTEGAELDKRAARGEISWERAREDPYRHVIYSAVLGGRIEEISHGDSPQESGDVFVLASDGIETLEEDAIAAICAEHAARGAAAVAAALIAGVEAGKHPHQDNTTVVVVIPPGGGKAAIPHPAESG